MSVETLIELNAEDKDRLCFVAKVLSSPVRIDIIGLLYLQPMCVQDVAQHLNLPQSSAALHISLLEDAGIIKTYKEVRGGKPYKMCRVEKYLVNIILRVPIPEIDSVASVSVPIGSYWDCYAKYPCGLISDKRYIGVEDELKSFYLLERQQAQLIWMKYGYLEYRVANPLPPMKRCKRLSLSMELCSEAPGYDEDFPSDITISVNGVEVGVYLSPGDYGRRRGILTPDFFANGLTQYGKLVEVDISDEGVLVNGEKTGGVTLKDLQIDRKPYVTFRIECKKDAVNRGGFNLFGAHAGDFSQDIELSFFY